MIVFLKDALKKTFTAFAVYPVLVFGIACGTWIGTPKKPKPDNGNAAVSLTMQGTGPSLSLMAQSVAVIDKAGRAAGTIKLSAATMAMKEIQLRLSANENGSESQFVGPYIVDLLTNKITPSPARIETSAGIYNEIILKLEKLKGANASASDPLLNRTFYVKGDYFSVSGESRRFTFTYDVEEDFLLGAREHKSKGTELIGDAENSVIIKFQISKWFKFNNAETNGSNVDFSDLPSNEIDLSETAQGVGATLRKVILSNMKHSPYYGRDQDGDGKLSNLENDNQEDDNEPESD